jgi:UDP-N-acetylmuramoyl-tripeptide--D-alanyl-D-alanine ligase
MAYRSVLPSVFVGITGSGGKTTTKHLTAAVLSSCGARVRKGAGNLPFQIAQSILRTKPWDELVVQEMAAGYHGGRISLEVPLRIVKPRIGVVTTIGADHISAYKNLEAIAAEKAKLVTFLPSHGTAVLNADDPLVLRMRDQCSASVMTYGRSPAAMVRAEDVRCNWPERLSFTVVYENQSLPVRTRLCGAHFVSCVLAALTAGLAARIPLADAVRAVADVPPSTQRMSPVQLPGDITVMRDDVKAPVWSIPLAFNFMREAEASQKIIVIGTLSDYTGNSDRVFVSVARQALEVADHVIFIGERSGKALKATPRDGERTLRAFSSSRQARQYVGQILRPGALMLLKGTRTDDFDSLLPPEVSEPPGIVA